MWCGEDIWRNFEKNVMGVQRAGTSLWADSSGSCASLAPRVKGLMQAIAPGSPKPILGASRDLWQPGEELLLCHLPAQTERECDTGQVRWREEQKEGKAVPFTPEGKLKEWS